MQHSLGKCKKEHPQNLSENARKKKWQRKKEFLNKRKNKRKRDRRKEERVREEHHLKQDNDPTQKGTKRRIVLATGKKQHQKGKRPSVTVAATVADAEVAPPHGNSRVVQGTGATPADFKVVCNVSLQEDAPSTVSLPDADAPQGFPSWVPRPRPVESSGAFRIYSQEDGRQCSGLSRDVQLFRCSECEDLGVLVQALDLSRQLHLVQRIVSMLILPTNLGADVSREDMARNLWAQYESKCARDPAVYIPMLPAQGGAPLTAYAGFRSATEMSDRLWSTPIRKEYQRIGRECAALCGISCAEGLRFTRMRLQFLKEDSKLNPEVHHILPDCPTVVVPLGVAITVGYGREEHEVLGNLQEGDKKSSSASQDGNWLVLQPGDVLVMPHSANNLRTVIRAVERNSRDGSGRVPALLKDLDAEGVCLTLSANVYMGSWGFVALESK